jgi:hypothetical protein
MRSEAHSGNDYLEALPEGRRIEVARVRDVVRASLPDGYVESMNWGMICWEVPLETSGPTYNGKPLMYVALASQKRHLALYLCGANCLPGVRDALEAAFAAEGKRFDMGAACLRFRSADELPLEAVAAAVAAVPVRTFLAAAQR